MEFRIPRKIKSKTLATHTAEIQPGINIQM